MCARVGPGLPGGGAAGDWPAGPATAGGWLANPDPYWGRGRGRSRGGAVVGGVGQPPHP